MSLLLGNTKNTEFFIMYMSVCLPRNKSFVCGIGFLGVFFFSGLTVL
jgi:hypothetical protein